MIITPTTFFDPPPPVSLSPHPTDQHNDSSQCSRRPLSGHPNDILYSELFNCYADSVSPFPQNIFMRFLCGFPLITTRFLWLWNYREGSVILSVFLEIPNLLPLKFLSHILIRKWFPALSFKFCDKSSDTCYKVVLATLSDIPGHYILLLLAPQKGDGSRWLLESKAAGSLGQVSSSIIVEDDALRKLLSLAHAFVGSILFMSSWVNPLERC